jgi:hypothetical protein
MALDFPSNPANNQTYNNFIYDAAKGTWKSLSSGASPNFLVNPTITNAVITATATTPSTVPITVNGAASQSANLQDWKNSAGITLSSINSSGHLNTNTISTVGLNLSRQDAISEGGQINFKRSTDDANSWYLDVYGSTSTPNFRVVNNSQIPIDINYNGVIRMENQPAFYSQGSGTTAFAAPQRDDLIPFTIVELNRGNHFNASNSRFTAPVSGVYCFWMQAATTDATSTGPEIYIIKNGSAHNNVAISYNSAFYNTFGGSYIINLNANDYVQMAIRNNNGTTFTIERGRSRFAGYLIG